MGKNSALGKIGISLLKGICIWGFAGWVYVAAIVLNPSTAGSQLWNLSYLVPVPTNVFGVSCFALSFIAFIAWEALK